MSDLIRREDALALFVEDDLIPTEIVRACIEDLPAMHLATNAELEALKKAAGIAHLPTQLTFEARLAIGGEGPRAYDWSDKPHRIVYDLCREIEKNTAERDRLREALWAILACETPNANATVTRMASITKAALKGETP